MTGILERLKQLNPDRNVAFTAVEQLSSDEDILEFYNEYVKWMRDGKVSNPESVAIGNLSYIVVYYSQEITQRWKNALPNFSHPVFGSDILWQKKE